MPAQATYTRRVLRVRPLADLDPLRSIDVANEVFASSVAAELRDDRFGADSWLTAAGRGELIGAFAERAGDAVGFAGGLAVGPGGDGLRTVVLDCLVTEPDALGPVVRVALEQAERSGAQRVELWRKPSAPEDDELMEALGALPYRALHQMRCRLPLDVPMLDTRAFRPGDDDEDLVRVNNRAFAHHPSQGKLSIEAFRSDMTQPWFEPDGVRMYEVDGTLAGFCWTKRHAEPALGEVYVICIDPDFHGRGLGRPMTAAGLHWLAEQGEEVGMLYVEADNVPAIRTYEGLGFRIVRTDRAWVLET